MKGEKTVRRDASQRVLFEIASQVEDMASDEAISSGDERILAV